MVKISEEVGWMRACLCRFSQKWENLGMQYKVDGISGVPRR